MRSVAAMGVLLCTAMTAPGGNGVMKPADFDVGMPLQSGTSVLVVEGYGTGGHDGVTDCGCLTDFHGLDLVPDDNRTGAWGVPVVAAASGTVMLARTADRAWWGLGQFIWIVHDYSDGSGAEYSSFYAYLDTFSVAEGQHVERGQVIGTIGWGNDHLSGDPLPYARLHFSMHVNAIAAPDGAGIYGGDALFPEPLDGQTGFATNSIHTSFNAQAPRSDVTVVNLRMEPAQPRPGDVVRFFGDVRNAGAGASPEGTYLGVGLWVDDVKIGWFAELASLQPGALLGERIFNTTWSATPGHHTIRAMADDVNRFPESREDNNNASLSIDVAAPSDAVGFAFTPAQPRVNDVVTVRVDGTIPYACVGVSARSPSGARRDGELTTIEGSGPWTWTFSLRLVESGVHALSFTSDTDGMLENGMCNFSDAAVTSRGTTQLDVRQVSLSARAVRSTVFISGGTQTILPGQVFSSEWIVENTGNTTWTAADAITVRHVAGRNFGLGSAVPLAGDVEPGAQHTFTASMRAPQETGMHQGTWRLFSGENPFGDPINVDVLVQVLSDDAAFSSAEPQGTQQSAPGGQVFKTVTMRNSGTTSWSASEGYALQRVDGEAFGMEDALPLPPGSVVLPGSSRIFSFELTAPADSGVHHAAWRMARAGSAFGASADIAMEVTSTPVETDAASLLNQDPPQGNAVQTNSTLTQTWLVRNTGTTTWKAADGYALVFVDGQDFQVQHRVGLRPGFEVPPGGQYAWNLDVIMPSQPGNPVGHFRMARGDAQFGPVLNADFIVQPHGSSASSSSSGGGSRPVADDVLEGSAEEESSTEDDEATVGACVCASTENGFPVGLLLLVLARRFRRH